MDDRPVLLYDGDCGFCHRWALWAQRRGAAVDFARCQEATELREALGIPDGQCTKTAIYVDDGRVLTHDRAINAVLKRLPGRRNAGWRVVGRIGSLAPLRPLGAFGYWIVAKNRHRLRGPKEAEDA